MRQTVILFASQMIYLYIIYHSIYLFLYIYTHMYICRHRYRYRCRCRCRCRCRYRYRYRHSLWHDIYRERERVLGRNSRTRLSLQPGFSPRDFEHDRTFTENGIGNRESDKARSIERSRSIEKERTNERR